MNVLETILNFLTSLARIIFPRKRRSAVGDCPCPHPLPAPVELPLALAQGDWGYRQKALPSGADWLGISGYSLMLMGGAGCLYKWFIT